MNLNDASKGLNTTTVVINQITALLAAVQPEIAAGRIAAAFIVDLVRRLRGATLTNEQIDALLGDIITKAEAERAALADERTQAEADLASGQDDQG